jgi:hypothetical protein
VGGQPHPRDDLVGRHDRRTLAPAYSADVAQHLLDADELVVLGQPVRPRQRARLDLPAVRGHGEVGDGRVLVSPERCDITQV